MTPILHFHGAAGGVTGSCARLETEAGDILIDCGMFQGSKTLKSLNYGAFPFAPRKIAAVLLTHAHIDHSGLLPKLRLAGFDGPIYATAGTRALCAVMLPDSGAIQEMEIETLNRRNERRGEAKLSPIYTAADANETMALFHTVAYDQWITIAPGVRARWWNAGHILGSASIEIEIATAEAPMRLLFSGDLGPGARDFSSDPEGPTGVDHLIMESTYGGAERPRLDAAGRRALLAAEMKAAHAAGGPLLIPAFAVERTQELLVDLISLMDDVEAPPGPIFLDSPLAIKATDVFLSHGYDADMGRNPFGHLREGGRLRFTESASESRDIERFRGWHVIIAASGMCDAGRVRHHLKRLLWRREATVLLVGYQAVGTLGRLLSEGRKDVRIQGEPIQVRAHIRQLDVYSGHADGPTLARWANARGPVAGSTFLVHGEPDNATAMRQLLVKAGFAENRVTIPRLDQAYSLRPGAASEDAQAGAARIEPEVVSRLDWNNARAEFMGALDIALRGAKSDAERKKILEKLSSDLKV